MKTNDLFPQVTHFFSLYKNNPSAVSMHKKLLAESNRIAAAEDVIYAIDTVKPLYEDSLRMLEHDIVDTGFDHRLLDLQRKIFRELEHLLSRAQRDSRHHIMVIIPVADRPALLSNCLESLKEQCRIFQYGGTSVDEKGTPYYKKVSVFIFDDSEELSNINAIKALSSELNAVGIRTYYVGLDEQSSLLQQVPREPKKDISRIIGDVRNSALSHKGASVTRNIAYLYMHSVIQQCGEKALLYFIDSDEEFSIAALQGEAVKNVSFINYFYWLDVLFNSMDIDMLTGKVVGDPPVSPAVMINTFLEDLLSFFEIISELEPSDNCVFHEPVLSHAFSANYHDMATLFGYQGKASPEKYACPLKGNHTVYDTLTDFAKRVMDFFYGLHPTRTQFYRHPGDATNIEHARTVYTGNYVLSSDGLRHFIPFAHLNLRMAGPTLGRILKQQIKDRFVSANLPLSHRRVRADNTIHEFRSGVSRNRESPDLSGEFFRQFWGDVMLFSVESLTETGFPEKTVPIDEISSVVSSVHERLYHAYKEKQAVTMEKIRELNHYLSGKRYWWNSNDHLHDSVNRFKRFSQLVDDNFGAQSKNPDVISDRIAEGIWTRKIVHAIHNFSRDTELWDAVLNTNLVVKHSL